MAPHLPMVIDEARLGRRQSHRPDRCFSLELELESDLAGRDGRMKRKRSSEEQIIGILKEAEAGAAVANLRRTHGMRSPTF